MLKINLLSNAASTALNFLIPLISLPYASRVLGPEGVGSVGLANAFAGSFLMFSGLVGTIYGTREVARSRHDPAASSRIFWELWTINLVAQVLVMAIYGLVVVFSGLGKNVGSLYGIAAFIFVSSAFNVDWYYMGLEKFPMLFWRNLLGKVVSLGLLFLLVRDPGDTLGYALVSVSAVLVGNIWSFLGVLPLLSKTTKMLVPWRHMVSLGGFYVINMLTVVSVNWDKVLLGNLSDAFNLGLYSLADKIVLLGISVSSALISVLLPRVSHSFSRGNEDAVKRDLTLGLRFVFLLGLPLVAGTMILAPEVVLLLGGTQFTGTSTSLRIMAPMILSIGLAGIFGVQVLSAQGRERQYMISLLISNIAMVCASLLLVKQMGSEGTAWAVLVGSCVQVAVQYVFTRGFIRNLWYGMQAWRYMVAAGSMSLVVVLVRLVPVLQVQIPLVQVVVLAGVGALIYFGVLVMVREPLVTRIVGLSGARDA